MRDDVYLRRMANALRVILNDLKRNEDVAATELGIARTVLDDVLGGKRTLPAHVIKAATRIWPVNERDFFPIRDDASDGIKIVRAADSTASSRVLKRAGQNYYEYRDTATSSASTLRPEWLKILNAVGDCDPYNKSVQWNNGHFLYQVTYFIGPVNYYYEWQGEKYCEAMNTGDSIVTMPFVAHSFSSRDHGALGQILALTYGGRLSGNGEQELAVLGSQAVERLTLEMSDPAKIRAAILRRAIADASMSVDHLATASCGSVMELNEIIEGRRAGREEEWESIAQGLGMPLRELTPVQSDVIRGVKIVRKSESRVWSLPDEANAVYHVRELSGTTITPYSRGLEVSVLKNASGTTPYDFEVSQHEYGYVVGEEPVQILWVCDGLSRSETLSPGDSFYVKPLVSHRFAPFTDQRHEDAARVLILRVGGAIVGDALIEASFIGAAALRKRVHESTLWYDPMGRN